MLLKVGECGSDGDSTSVVLSIDPDGERYRIELIVFSCRREGEDWWIGRGGDGDGK